MRVVRFTFDICVHKTYSHDVYTLASALAKHIMGLAGVCGCEVKASQDPYSDERDYSMEGGAE